MTRRSRTLTLGTSLIALALALSAAPANASEPTQDDQLAAAGIVGKASTATPTGADAVVLPTTLLDLLGEGLGAIDDGPWVDADDPHGLPLNLTPPLPVAKTTRARAYSDDCHAGIRVRKAKGCEYGDTDSQFTVLLMGDSHGAMWLPAFEQIAARRGWRIHLLTKSACPPPRVDNMRKRTVYTDCVAWRENALKVIKGLKPDLAILTSTADYKLADIKQEYSKKYLKTWRKAWQDTIRTIGKSAGHVVVLNDVPKWTEDAVECLTEHADDVRVCATPRDVAVRPDMTRALREAAEATGATFVDPSVLVCPDEVCPVVDGRYLITYDTSHLTPVYASLLSERLEEMLPVEDE